MKIKLLAILLLLSATGMMAQSAIQTINSGSITAPSSRVSIGEIIIVPQNTTQSQSGIVGILAQNQQTLPVPQFAVATDVIAFPNPTTAGVIFQSAVNLTDQEISIYSNAGQLVITTKISASNEIDLSSLSAGIYLIRFADKTLNPFKIIKY